MTKVMKCLRLMRERRRVTVALRRRVAELERENRDLANALLLAWEVMVPLDILFLDRKPAADRSRLN